MQEITKIVVPVDFSKNTDKLVEFAIYMASKLSAEISFVHVAESFKGYDMMLGSTSFTDIKKEVRAGMEQRMANLVQDNGEKCSGCAGKVVDGDKVDGITAYAEAEKANLLIIGTHGTKGLEKILLGSVAERVVKRAACPVLTFNPYK